MADGEEEPRRRREPANPADAKWLVSRGAEQGYYDEQNQWVTTGWHDNEGYWFEACGEFSRRGKWIGTGKFDVYDPEGDWYETGYFDENDEWVVEVRARRRLLCGALRCPAPWPLCPR